jgi:hypothetical protein
MSMPRILAAPLAGAAALALLAGCVTSEDIMFGGQGTGFCTELRVPMVFGIPVTNTGASERTIASVDVLEANGMQIDEIWISTAPELPSFSLFEVSRADEAVDFDWSTRAEPEGFSLQPGTDYTLLVVGRPGDDPQRPLWAQGVRIEFDGWPPATVQSGVSFGYTGAGTGCGPATG